MDFFAMKRKKLQSLCKKHGIPANLKNSDMAEKLSLIYKEEKNENPGSRRLRSDVNKSNVEIIVLDSDSDSEVQMEASDTVAEKDSNEKTNVSTEHLLDEEPDQSLTTSPRSEVKSSNHNIHHMVDSEEIKQVCKLDDNIYVMDEAAAMCLDASTAMKHTDEVKSNDLNDIVSHPLRSDEDKSNLEITELDSEKDIDVQMEASDTVAEKDCNERTNVSAEHLLDEEPNQFITTSPLSEVKSSDLNNLESHLLRSDEDKSNLGSTDSGTDVQMEASDTVAEKDCNERTNVSAEHLLDEEPNQFITTSPLSEVKSSDLNNLESHLLRSDEDKSNLGSTDSGTDVQMEVSDTVAEKDCNERTNVSAEHLLDEEPSQFTTTSPISEVKSSDLNSFGSYSGFGNYMMLGDQTSSERTDVHEDTDLHQGSVEQFNKSDVYHCVISQSAKTCLDVNVENILDEVHSSSFEDSDETPVQFLDAEKMVVTGTATRNAYTSGAKFESSQKMSITPASKEIVGSSAKLLNNSVSPRDVVFCNLEESVQIGADKEQVDPSQEKMVEFSPKLFNNPGTPANGGIGLCGLEENLEIGVNKENIDPNEDVIYAEPSAMVMSDNQDVIQAVSEELGNKLMEENLEIGVNKENIDSNEDVIYAEPSAMVMSDNEDVIQAVSEEFRNSLMEDEVANMEDKFDLLGDVHESVNPGGTNSAHGSNIKTALNTYVTGGDILDEVHSSSFEDSDATPVQFLKTDPLREAETSVLNLHKMFETAIATKNADTGGVKFESSTKMSLSLTPEKMIGSSTKLLKNSGAPTHFGFCDVDENLQIGRNKVNIDPSDEILHAEPSLVVTSDNEEVDLSIHQMAALEACEEEMLKSSEKTCMVADPEECIGFSLNDLQASTTKGSEVETYFESTALGDVMETCNMEGCMETNMIEGENSQEENQGYSGSWKKKGSDVDDNSGANSDEEVRADELVPAVPQSSEMESCDFGLQQLFAQGEITMIEAENNQEDCVSAQREVVKFFDNSDVHDDIGRDGAKDVNQASSASWKRIRSDMDDASGASSTEQVKAGEITMIEAENNQEGCVSAQREVVKFFDNSDVHDDIGRDGAKDVNQASSASWKRIRSDMDDASGASSIEQVKAGEITMIEVENNQEDCVSAQREVVKFFDNSDVHDDIGRDGAKDVNQASSASRKRIRSDMDNASGASSIEQVKAGEITMIEAENNQEDCVSAQREVVKFFDNSDVHDDIGRDGAKDVNQASSASRKRIRSDMDDASGASSIEQVKAGELVPAVPQSSMDSCNFSLQQIFAQDTASGDQDVCPKKLDSPSKATPIASGEKNIIFTPMFNESSMMHKEMEIAMIEEENNAQWEVCKFLDTSDVHVGIGLDGAKDENQAYWASRKRKMSDVDDTSGGNSNEEVKADEFVPAVPHSSEMESCDFGFPQLFAQDTASGDEDAYQKKLDSSSKGTPTASGEKSIVFTPKLQESSMMRKKMRIEMNLSQKPATRDSVGTCDMKENIKTDKKEVDSSTVSRNKFAKRLPLQDLHQN
ncbi:uncharacterized protein LOC127127511 isoform X20 [Lathyrus oleraceus]|uniref:uncharacterized protein LOC127127511 isoform X20 n=1 Tax=Pisum sativum TaxID=3888 RepID=UPI0021CE25E9|nr:uncharacterized protein LOC127127511 isoform X20 [Pisum sativum]